MNKTMNTTVSSAVRMAPEKKRADTCWRRHGTQHPRRTMRACIAAFTWCVVASAPAQDNAADDTAALRAQQTVFRAVAQRLRPSLVRIETVGGSQPPEFTVDSGGGEDNGDAPPQPKPRSQNPFRDTPGAAFAVADGPTTGMVYSRDGYVVTSSFNFVLEPQLISVTLADGRRLAADLVARDQVRKIALLKVDANDLTPPAWAEGGEVRVGQWAVALGLGFGGEQPGVNVGVVSALGRMAGNALQTDARISPANYGGPLADIHGRVLGLCVPMAQRPGELAGVEMYDSGIGFAVPKLRLEKIVAGLMTGQSVYRGWLGINVDHTRPDAVVIRNLADPSPLRQAGALPGDRIIEAAGQETLHFGHLVQALYMIPAGEIVSLKLQRGDQIRAVDVPLVRGVELGPLPELPEPFDPSNPVPPGPSPPHDPGE